MIYPQILITLLIAILPPSLQTQKRIVGGQANEYCTSYPWIVRLDIDGYEVCGGTVLDATHILTAAHCVSQALTITATVGENDVTIVEGTEQVFEINVASGVAVHPNFSYSDLTNDIAVLKLTTPIDLTLNCSSPVSLDPTFKVTYGQKCRIAGWGLVDENSYYTSDILRSASVSTYLGSSCKTAFPNADDLTDSNKQLCAGETAGGVDSCWGDGGGPLVCFDDVTIRWNLVGVSSYGEGCGRPGHPGVYSDVSAFYPWIQQQL